MIILRTQDGKSLSSPSLTLKEITDPAECDRVRTAIEAHRRNADWLQGQWPNLLPQARGKRVAVAAQEAFIAETSEEALAWIRSRHPDDPGAFVQYVPPTEGPRIYAHRG
jgi:hypothetical protein